MPIYVRSIAAAFVLLAVPDRASHCRPICRSARGCGRQIRQRRFCRHATRRSAWSRAAATRGPRPIIERARRTAGSMADPDSKKVYVTGSRRQARSTPRPASRGRRRAATSSSAVRVNNRLRRAIDAALGGADACCRPIRRARSQAAQAVFKSREEAALPAARRRARQGDRSDASRRALERGARRDPAGQVRRHRSRQARGRRRDQRRAATRRRWRC